jgi:gliding motility-associated-like protein
VFNDNGSTFPLNLPNTGLVELTYDNNVGINNDFRFSAALKPNEYTLMPQEQVTLEPVTVRNGVITHATWESSPYLNCTGCIKTTFTALYRQDTVTTVKVRAYTEYGCYSDDTATIHMPVLDDYTVKLNQVECARGDSLHVDFSLCNVYPEGNVPDSLQVDFYDRLPDDSAAVKLGSTFFTPKTSTSACSDYELFMKTTTTGKVFAVVNKDRLKYPASSGLNEFNFDNNLSSLNYEPFAIQTTPEVMAMPRQTSVPLHTTVSGGAAVKYVWGPPSGLSCLDCPEPVATATASMKYLVTVTNKYYCQDTASVHIKTFVNAGITLPNAFSPNGDGLNDYFYVIGNLDIKKVKNLSVFNRYGQKVFESLDAPANDRKYGWDGYVKGKRADFGTYVYVATVEFMDGSVQHAKGILVVVP